MLFFIEYQSGADGGLVNLRRYSDDQLKQAKADRLERELDCRRQGIERELVLLQSETEENLRRTHGRYFYSVEELVRRLKDSLDAKLRPTQ